MVECRLIPEVVYVAPFATTRWRWDMVAPGAFLHRNFVITREVVTQFESSPTLASLDDSATLKPTRQSWAQGELPPFTTGDNLAQFPPPAPS